MDTKSDKEIIEKVLRCADEYVSALVYSEDRADRARSTLVNAVVNWRLYVKSKSKV